MNMTGQAIIESGAGIEGARPQRDLFPDHLNGVTTSQAIEGSLELANSPISNGSAPPADSKPGVGEKNKVVYEVQLFCPFYDNRDYLITWLIASGTEEARAWANKLRPSFEEDDVDLSFYNYPFFWDVEIFPVDEARTGVTGHVWSGPEIESARLEKRIGHISEKLADQRRLCVDRAFTELVALLDPPAVDDKPE